jgi:hypothetical protein
MEILVCVKRVPTVGGVIKLTADQRAIVGDLHEVLPALIKALRARALWG